MYHRQTDALHVTIPCAPAFLAVTAPPARSLRAILAHPQQLCVHPARATPRPAAVGVKMQDPTSVAAALAATGHYTSVLVAYGLLVAERMLVKSNPSAREATMISLVDAGYGIVGLGILYSGFLRATKYAKGWDFYSHSPLFWAKMLALGILTALSLYPTITFIRGAVAAAKLEDKSEFVPVSEGLAARLKLIINAELGTFLLIPLFATLMSRGILFREFTGVPPSAMMAGAVVPTFAACFMAVRAAVDEDGLR